MKPSSHPVPLVAVTGGMKLGGSTTFLLNLARGLAEHGYALPIVSATAPNEMAGDFARFEVPVKVIDHRESIYEDRILEVYHAVRRHQPTSVWACLGSEGFEFLRLVPRGVKRIAVVQSDDPGPYRLMEQFGPWIDVAVGVSETIGDRLRKIASLRQAQVACVPYGIASGTTPPRTPPEGKKLRLIYLGRMTETQKRISRLVELAGQLVKAKLPHRFTFAGSGSDLESVQAALKDNPNVSFLGEVRNSEIPNLLVRQDVLVLLSDFEGLPLSLIEAMGMGVVPVVSDLESGIRQLVTDDTGIRVPVGDVAAAANAVLELARNPERLARLSAAARARARGEYSASQMARNYLDLIGPPAQEKLGWDQNPTVPTPLGVSPAWWYRGAGRHLRRWLKAFSSAAQRSSSPL